MWRSTAIILLFSLVAAARGAAAPGGESSAATAVDTVASVAVVAGSAQGEAPEAEVDPAYAWTIWKDLSRAIALQKLDGPGDIVEKADIIRDRIDDLTAERLRLATALEEWSDRHESLEIQLEVLEDLAKVQLGGDLQLQQRMHHMRERHSMATDRKKALAGSIRALDVEVKRLTDMAKAYKQEANELRRSEADRSKADRSKADRRKAESK